MQRFDAVKLADEERATGWRLATRVAFRFCVVYFGLFCLLFAEVMFVFTGIVGWWLPPEAMFWQMNTLGPVTEWVGRHVFGVDAALHTDSRSGDQTAMWVLMVILLVVALAATTAWSVLDRRRSNYHRLHAWFSVFLRICLGAMMLYYGAVKVIPIQMPALPLRVLLQPYGQLSPNSVLFLQIGTSYPYERALGAVELAAGVLLFWPRTATLGAVLALASMAEVFVMNMTFGVSVKILSGQLLMIAVVLLAPHAKRLANMFVLQRPSPPVTQPTLFTSARANTIASGVQVAVGAWVLLSCLLINGLTWREDGGGTPKPELYGIWSVTEFTRDGTALPPLTTQRDRWQRLVIDDPDTLTYQRMDGELVTVPALIDSHRITLFTESPSARLTIDHTEPDRLRLTGKLAGRPVTMTLQRLDLNSLPLRSHGFHWVQDYPDLYPGFK